MNILFFINSLRPGGKERQLAELVKSLARHGGYNCYVISMSYDNQYLNDKEYRIDIMLRKCRKDIVFFSDFYFKAKNFHPDIIHTWDPMTSIYAIPAAFLLKAKIVNGSIRDAPPNLKLFNKRYFITRFSFLFSSIIVANSLAGLKAYKISWQKAICIYNGFDLSRITHDNKNITKDKFNIFTTFVVGMVASYSLNKDYQTFFRAAERVIENMHDVTFVAVGEGTNEDKCKNLVSPPLRKYFRFLGKQDNVESIVNQFNIGVLATSNVHGEGISNAIMEYMAMGKPVVATDAGGTNELIVDGVTGFLVPRSNHTDLADKIISLLQNKELANKMGIAGRQRVENEFSQDKMIGKYIELYSMIKKNIYPTK